MKKENDRGKISGNSFNVNVKNIHTIELEFKPYLYSFLKKDVIRVEGIDVIRRDISALIFRYLHKRGIRTHYIRKIGKNKMLCTNEYLPPIEVVVKRKMVGSLWYDYDNIENYKTRFGFSIKKTFKFENPVIRFDWRNPYPIDDKVMPDSLADYFIDTIQAKETANLVFKNIELLFTSIGYEILDICLFISQDGKIILGEISPDNTRLFDKKRRVIIQKLKNGFGAENNGTALISAWKELLEKLSAL